MKPTKSNPSQPISDDFLARIRDRVRGSALWTAKSKESSGKYSGLCCPECGKGESWSYVERPFAIICSRKSKCGAIVKTLDVFPDLLLNVEKDYAPTKGDPHRPAREYLHSRGLDKSLVGLRFEYWKNIRKLPTGGVMFYVGKNAAGEDVWNGRLFNPPPGQGKTHNVGSISGLFWKHPDLDYGKASRIYITEGIIDALSLIEMDCHAIAVLSCGQDPSKIDLNGLVNGRSKKSDRHE